VRTPDQAACAFRASSVAVASPPLMRTATRDCDKPMLQSLGGGNVPTYVGLGTKSVVGRFS
jgi:hypothetical protein